MNEIIYLNRMIIKLLVAFVVCWFLSKIFATVKGYQDYLYYKKQGVVFTDNSWSLTRDIKALMGVIKKYPTAFSWLRLFRA